MCARASPSGIAGWKARGWKTATREPVKNLDLWQRLDALVQLGFAVNVGQLDGDSLSVWPNPATDFLLVGTSRSGAQARVTIYGSDGRIEREVSVSGEPAWVDLSGLAPGLKSIAVAVGGRVERFKLVKE